MTAEGRIPVSCNKDCGGGCALSARVRNGRIEKIIDSPYKTPAMRGCIKGYRMPDALYSPERLQRPLLRTGERGSGDFREITWEEAYGLAAEKLAFYKNKYGASAVMRIGGSGSCRGALHNTATLAERFLSLYGGYTNTTGNFSSEASDFVKPYMFGTKYVGIDVKTLFFSKLVILWGMNPEGTRMGAESEGVFSELAGNGIPFIILDPRKTASVRKYNAWWLPVKPGTDSALMLGVLFSLLKAGAVNHAFLEKYSTGFGKLERYILGESDGIPKSPRWASSLCGISSRNIEKFAEMYGSVKPAALLSGLSVQRTIGGENTDRLGAVLQLATGNFGIPGGAPGCGQWNKIPSPRCGKMSVPKNTEVQEVPVYQWADAVLEGKAGGFPSDIKMLYNVGGNYIGQGSDTEKAMKAFSKVDFAITHDYFLTPTAVYSDLVLPVTTFLERNDIVFSNSKYLFYSAKAADPSGESKNDYAVFSELSRRLGFYDEFTESRTEKEWLDFFMRHSEIENTDDFKRTGIYKAPYQQYIGLSDFIADPEQNALTTPSGKIEIVLEAFPFVGGTELPEAVIMETSAVFPLRLITPHEKYRIHSQFDNISGFRKLTDRALWLNSADAAERGIENNSLVKITSETGEMTAPVRVTDAVAPGVVSLNQGAWVSRERHPGVSGLRIGGANPNFLTSTEPALPSRGSRTHSTAVQVERE